MMALVSGTVFCSMSCQHHHWPSFAVSSRPISSGTASRDFLPSSRAPSQTYTDYTNIISRLLLYQPIFITLSYARVQLSYKLCFYPSHDGNVSKPMNLGSHSFHRRAAQWPNFIPSVAGTLTITMDIPPRKTQESMHTWSLCRGDDEWCTLLLAADQTSLAEHDLLVPAKCRLYSSRFSLTPQKVSKLDWWSRICYW